MDRKERLQKVEEFIELYGANERSFDKLYSKLEEEFLIEWQSNSDLRANHYLNNLKQTKEKQARVYIETKRRRPKKGAPAEFREFVTAFRHDLMEAHH